MNQFEPFTEEQDLWIREHYWDMSLKELVEVFNETFNASRSYETVKQRCRKTLKLTRKRTDEMTQFIRDNYYYYSLKDLTDKFNEYFGQRRTEGVIKSWAYDLGLHFKDNDERWRKTISASWKTHARPIGSIYKLTGGYLYIKTAPRKYEMLHKYLWEKENGPVPEGYQLIFLDNNKENCSLDNICCISGRIHRELIKKKWRFDNAEQTRTAIMWYELFYAIKDKKGASNEILCRR